MLRKVQHDQTVGQFVQQYKAVRSIIRNGRMLDKAAVFIETIAGGHISEQRSHAGLRMFQAFAVALKGCTFNYN